MYSNANYASQLEAIAQAAKAEGIRVSDLRGAEVGGVYNLTIAPTEISVGVVDGQSMGFICLGELTLSKLVPRAEVLAAAQAAGAVTGLQVVQAPGRGFKGLERFAQDQHWDAFGHATVRCVFTAVRKARSGDDVTDGIFVWA